MGRENRQNSKSAWFIRACPPYFTTYKMWKAVENSNFSKLKSTLNCCQKIQHLFNSGNLFLAKPQKPLVNQGFCPLLVTVENCGKAIHNVHRTLCKCKMQNAQCKIVAFTLRGRGTASRWMRCFRRYVWAGRRGRRPLRAVRGTPILGVPLPSPAEKVST